MASGKHARFQTPVFDPPHCRLSSINICISPLFHYSTIHSRILQYFCLWCFFGIHVTRNIYGTAVKHNLQRRNQQVVQFIWVLPHKFLALDHFHEWNRQTSIQCNGNVHEHERFGMGFSCLNWVAPNIVLCELGELKGPFIRTVSCFCWRSLRCGRGFILYFCLADASSIWLSSYMKVWKMGPELSRLTISRWTHFSRSDKHIFIATVGPKICVKRSEFHFHSEWRDNKK